MEEKFRELYQKFWPALEPVLLSDTGMSPPLLLSPPDHYQRQNTRLFVVGQETNTWYNDRLRDKRGDAAIDALMTIYKDEFRLGLKWPTVFWQAVRDVERRLGIETGAILWSNLNKADQNDGPPSRQLEEQLLKVFPVLQSELVISKPDVVIFFTGPAYDRLIASSLEGSHFQPVESTGLPEREFAQVKHEVLPERSFRTYHPKHLRLRKMTDLVLSHIGRLCADRR